LAIQPRGQGARRKSPEQRRNTGTIPDRYAAFARGELTIDDLDEEEVMRGQFRGKDGTFRGRPPKFIPREFATAIVRKQHELVATRIAGLVTQAFDTLADVMGKPFPQPGDAARVKAAQLVLERYLGRVPETVNIKSEQSTWDKNKERFIKTVHIGELEASPLPKEEEVIEGELEDPDQ
jgi:hypothetical protein